MMSEQWGEFDARIARIHRMGVRKLERQMYEQLVADGVLTQVLT